MSEDEIDGKNPAQGYKPGPGAAGIYGPVEDRQETTL